MISVLILTYNEEINLPDCLDSVSWSDDILIVDSFSSDKTVNIGQSRGVRVVQNKFINFAQQRNFGLDQDGWKYDWILHLDADERITPQLRDELLAAAKAGDKLAFRLPSKMMFMGRWLKYSGMYPWYQVRFGKRSDLRFVQVGHGQRETLPAENIGTLSEPMLHFSFGKGIADWVDKHNRYSTAEALQAIEDDHCDARLKWSHLLSSDSVTRKRLLKQVFRLLPFRPSIRFLYMYVVRLGFLDGRAGLIYCRMLRMYEMLIVVKSEELRRTGRNVM